MESKAGQNELKRQLGLFSSITLVIGVVVGSGIFFKAPSVFQDGGTAFLGVLAWVVAGLITIAAALTIAEIAVVFPRTGGVFVYLKELYGEVWGFAFGWMQSLIYIPAVCAALVLAFAQFTKPFFELSDKEIFHFLIFSFSEIKLFAFGSIVFVALVTLISTKAGSGMQSFVTIAKLLPIFAIIIFGFIKGDVSPELIVQVENANQASLFGFGAAIIGCLWAYDGWLMVTNMGGELKNPSRDLPRSIIIGLTVVILTYVLVNLALLYVLPVNEIISTGETATTIAAEKLFGSIGAKLVAAGILISVFGSFNGCFLAGSRIPYAMSLDRLFIFPKFFGKVNQSFKTPLNAIIFELFLVGVYIFASSFSQLTDLVVFVMWIFFSLTVAGIFVLRKKFGHVERAYKVPLYPVVPIIGLLGGIYIIISSCLDSWSTTLYGLLVTAVAFPIFFLIKAYDRKVNKMRT